MDGAIITIHSILLIDDEGSKMENKFVIMKVWIFLVGRDYF